MPIPMSSAQIADDMADRILRGDYAPGQKIETHRVLAEMYGVSVSTITAVMVRLKLMRLVEGAQGRGVYVVEDLPKGD